MMNNRMCLFFSRLNHHFLWHSSNISDSCVMDQIIVSWNRKHDLNIPPYGLRPFSQLISTFYPHGTFWFERTPIVSFAFLFTSVAIRLNWVDLPESSQLDSLKQAEQPSIFDVLTILEQEEILGFRFKLGWDDDKKTHDKSLFVNLY